MARILIKLGNISDSPADYIIASLETNDNSYPLEWKPIECLSPGDVEYEEVELEMMESFCANWESITDEENIEFEVSDEVDQLMIEMGCDIEYQRENED